MARQYVTSDGTVINETGSRQYVSSDGAFINETQSADVSTTGTIQWAEQNDSCAVTVNVAISGVGGTISWTEANDTFSATLSVATASGTLTTQPFKNNTGSVLSNLTGLTVTVLKLSDLSFIKNLTNQGTNSSGVLSVNDALFVSGTWYALVVANASGVVGVEKYQAA